MYSERFANYHANKEFINCQNPAIMDVNLSKKKVAGFLGQSYVLIPRKVLEMLFHGQGPGQIGRHGIPRLVLGSVFQGRTGLF